MILGRPLTAAEVSYDEALRQFPTSCDSADLAQQLLSSEASPEPEPALSVTPTNNRLRFQTNRGKFHLLKFHL